MYLVKCILQSLPSKHLKDLTCILFAIYGFSCHGKLLLYFQLAYSKNASTPLLKNQNNIHKSKNTLEPYINHYVGIQIRRSHHLLFRKYKMKSGRVLFLSLIGNLRQFTLEVSYIIYWKNNLLKKVMLNRKRAFYLKASTFRRPCHILFISNSFIFDNAILNTRQAILDLVRIVTPPLFY